MAGPLIPAPWLRRVVAEPPADLRWLWLLLDLTGAANPAETLRAGFANARAALATAPRPTEVFVRVLWPGSLLADPHGAVAVATAQAEGLKHLRADGHRVDGWVPACADPTTAEDLAAFASPPECDTCVLYARGACRGEGRDREPFARRPRAAPPPLPANDPEDWTPDACLGPTPAACWWPSVALLDAFAAEAQAAGGRVWDLGGGNGWLAARLARRGLTVTVVERHPPAGPPPAGVTRWVADVLDLPGAAPTPDAVVLSWPPTGAEFAAVIERLKPRVVLWATDAGGRCGIRPGQAGLVAGPAGVQWYLPEITDDSRLGSEYRVLRSGPTPGLAGQTGEVRILKR